MLSLTRRRLLLLGASAGVLCCNPREPLGAAGQDRRTAAARSEEALPPLRAPGDRRLLVGGRTAALRRRAHDGEEAFTRLREHVDRIGKHARGGAGAENAAVLHLLTEQKRYAQIALGEAQRAMARDFRGDSYLHFGDILRSVGMTLDLCGDAVSAAAAGQLATFLAEAAHELWFDNRGSGWGLADPGNNYHMAFLEGTTFAGYALARRGDPRARPLLDKVRASLESGGGVMDHLRAHGAGGDWHEGANYGQRSKQRLFMTLLAIESMGGPRYFDEARFFRDCIRFACYQLQPDRRSLHPSGDLARDSAMLVSPYDRHVVQLATYGIKKASERALGRWYLRHVVPSYLGKEFNDTASLYKDVLFATSGPMRSPETLPKSFVAKGTGFATVRSGWDADATCLTVSGSSRVEQSHAHMDVGSFTLFKGGWQAVDAASYSHTGLTWGSGAHNMVHVEGQERRGGEVGGLTHWSSKPERTYAAVDASDLFRRRGEDGATRTMVDEYTRELLYLGPDTLVVYDRVSAPAGVAYQARTHFATRPEAAAPNLYRARHGRGAVALAVVRGGRQKVLPDTDLEGGASEAFRVEIEPDGVPGRFLTVVRVALNDVPELEAVALKSRDPIDGVAFDDVVVVFSAQPRGAPLTQGMRYHLPEPVRRRTHWIINAQGAFDVQVRASGGGTEVEVVPGSAHQADGSGIVRFEA